MSEENVVFVHGGVLVSHKEGHLESSVGKWKQLETIVVNEINQTHKLHHHMASRVWETQRTNKEPNKR